MRRSWDSYFMALARAAATRATCDRAQVGCVIVERGRHIVLATGYNGAPPGLPHCDDAGHLLRGGRCVRTVHAEANALLRAGRDARGCTLYATHRPCLECTKLIVSAGIARVVFGVDYRPDPDAAAMLETASVMVDQFTEDQKV